MTMPAMRNVFSSHIDAIGYDAQTSQFYVKYKNGKTGVYQGVPAEIAASINNSASIGTAIHQELRGRYAHGYKE